MCDKGAEVAAHQAMPGGGKLRLDFSLDGGGNLLLSSEVGDGVLWL